MIVIKQFILAAAICGLVVCCAHAGPGSGLYQGNFAGTAIGDSDTSGTLTLNMTQNGSVVAGTAAVGSGIKVDTGGFICPGLVAIPAVKLNFKGNVSQDDSRHMEASSGIKFSGLTISADVLTDISMDNDTMLLQLKLNIPSPCRSSTLTATLKRT